MRRQGRGRMYTAEWLNLKRFHVVILTNDNFFFACFPVCVCVRVGECCRQARCMCVAGCVR